MDAPEYFDKFCKCSDEGRRLGCNYKTPQELIDRINSFCRRVEGEGWIDSIAWLKIYLGFRNIKDLMDMEAMGEDWKKVVDGIKSCWTNWQFYYYNEAPKSLPKPTKDQKRLKQSISGLMSAYLKRRKQTKRGIKTITIMQAALGYTLEDLKAHIESQFGDGMTWENYGSLWSIDHKTPDSWFQYTDITDEGFKKSWALENLQPLCTQLNSQKGNRYAHV